MLRFNMIKISLLILLSIIFTSCVNKHGISAKYYSDCREYYDLQGYYHKVCGEDDIITYKEMGEALKRKEPEPTGNVY
ncbi:MAG: hypothetical protein Q9M34_12225 [Sulfurimonas sp.]|nr:hypothetical protein [Sulfurimonas sp.]